jgi:DNA-binding response OmpR family regulator
MQKMLIIDDEEDLCSLLSAAMKKNSYRVDCVHTLAEAEKKLKTHFNIVLLDNNLPDGSGLDYYKRYPLRFKRTCIVLITADSRPGLAKKAQEAGIAAIIQKPFSIAKIKETITQLT